MRAAVDLELARRHAPVVDCDEREPFLPQIVGYSVLRQSGPSPTFDGYLLSFSPEVGGLPGFRRGRRGEGGVAAVEYALWPDRDIRLCDEVEHVWSALDAHGRLV